jgi:hypothetical protein
MPFGPLPYDVGPGTSLAFGVSPPVVPSWVLQPFDLSHVTSGIFRFSLSRNGSALFTLAAYVGAPPAYAAQSSTFVAMVYDFVGGEFGTQTGNYWVSLLLNLTSLKTIEVEPDVLTITTPWGQL